MRHGSELHYKLSGWNNNLLVIFSVFIILLVASMWTLAFFRARVVLNNCLNEVDSGRLVLTSIIIASIITILVWVIIQYVISKV